MKRSFLQFIDVSQLPPLPQFENIKHHYNNPHNNNTGQNLEHLANENEALKLKIEELKIKEFCVVFDKIGESFNFPIICNKTDTFKSVEEKFYDRYPEFLDTRDKNTFKVNGKTILDKSKTLEELNINYGNIIILENE